MYNRKTPHTMQEAALCLAPPAQHILRITFIEHGKEWCYELPKTPPCGLSSVRIGQILDDFSYALNARHRHHPNLDDPLYEHSIERSVHGTWLHAHANAMERDMRLTRSLASHLVGDHQPTEGLLPNAS